MRNASTPPLLQLEDICVRFGFVEALKSVNLTIDRKEVIAIVSVAIGLFFGFVPMKTDKTTESQNKYSQALGIVAVGLTILLIFAKQNLASWVAIFAMIAGWAVAKTPPLHRWVLHRFPWFEPAKPKTPLKSARSTKKK